jgi:hypothetical protein
MNVMLEFISSLEKYIESACRKQTRSSFSSPSYKIWLNENYVEVMSEDSHEFSCLKNNSQKQAK